MNETLIQVLTVVWRAVWLVLSIAGAIGYITLMGHIVQGHVLPRPMQLTPLQRWFAKRPRWLVDVVIVVSAGAFLGLLGYSTRLVIF